ncbi:MAG: helix-turn-helix transcriptional regulator [Candidatus Aquilonibacter sp.]
MPSTSSKRKASKVSKRRKGSSISSAVGSRGRAITKKQADEPMTYIVTASAWDGEPDQEELEAKSFLALEILRRIEALGISQREAAKRLGVAQADISKIVNFKVWGFSLPRLSQLLSKLGADVDIRVRVRYTDGPGSLRIATTKARRAA